MSKEFTPHFGRKDPPLKDNDLVEVQFLNMQTAKGRVFDWDLNWQWDDETADNPWCIIGYRLLEQEEADE